MGIPANLEDSRGDVLFYMVGKQLYFLLHWLCYKGKPTRRTTHEFTRGIESIRLESKVDRLIPLRELG